MRSPPSERLHGDAVPSYGRASAEASPVARLAAEASYLGGADHLGLLWVLLDPEGGDSRERLCRAPQSHTPPKVSR